MKRLPALPGKGRRFSAAERAAAAARATAAVAARTAAAAATADTELEADEHAFLVSRLRQRLALLHAAGEGDAAAESGGAGGGEAHAAENDAASAAATDADRLLGAATDPRLLRRRDVVGSGLKVVNDVESLKRKLAEIAYVPPAGMRRTPWIETLAVVAPPAVAAAAAVDGTGNAGEGEAAAAGKESRTKSIDANADIEREAYFMRLTAAAATEGLRRLRQLRVKFTRPSDFYAEMLKSDQHMGRVRARVAEERQQQQEFLDKKNRARDKKFHKKSGHKLLRAQEEARLRNIELQQLEEWKRRRRSPDDRLGLPADAGGSTGSGAPQKRQQQPHTAGAGGKGTAVEAALDQWLADREKDKGKQHKASPHARERRPSSKMQRHPKKSKKQRRRK